MTVSAGNARSVDVAGVVEAAPVSRLQLLTLALCATVIVLDGYDLLVIAITAPAIAQEWGLPHARLGQLFGAGIIGMTVGSFLLGPLGDRIGRKRCIAASVAVFGVFSLASAWAQSEGQLLVLRALTGLGLGGVVPNATALVAEYAPGRWRAPMVASAIVGFAVGGLVCAALATLLVPAWGWRSLYVVGGIAPLVLVPALVRALPESIRFLALRRADGARLAALLSRIHPAGAYQPGDHFHVARAAPGFPVRALYRDGRGHDTALLWLAFFVNMMVMFYLVNWVPTLAQRAGFGPGTVQAATLALNLGGVLGPLVLALAVRRYGSRRVLAAGFVAAAVGLAALGGAGARPVWFTLCAAWAGFFVFGVQINLHALAAGAYPTEIRATGVGWALGSGRIGSIIGPLLGGLLLTLGWGMGGYFAVFAGLMLLAALAISRVRHDDRARPVIAAEAAG